MAEYWSGSRRGNFSPDNAIPDYILNDLCTRFIINLPDDVAEDKIRLCFQIELAHWFYIDFYCVNNEKLKRLNIREFAKQVVYYCPTLEPIRDNIEDILAKWKGYKHAVPTYGAILLDASLEYCLLVKGFEARSSWGFPKGKINENESPSACAIREVLEETGFDIEPMLDTRFYLERLLHMQIQGLFIVPGVPLNTCFKPKTRQEIKDFGWFRVKSLPEKKSEALAMAPANQNQQAFFMVIPFARILKEWIVLYKQELARAARVNKPVAIPMGHTARNYYDVEEAFNQSGSRQSGPIDHRMFSANPMGAIHYKKHQDRVAAPPPADPAILRSSPEFVNPSSQGTYSFLNSMMIMSDQSSKHKQAATPSGGRNARESLLAEFSQHQDVNRGIDKTNISSSNAVPQINETTALVSQPSPWYHFTDNSSGVGGNKLLSSSGAPAVIGNNSGAFTPHISNSTIFNTGRTVKASSDIVDTSMRKNNGSNSSSKDTGRANKDIFKESAPALTTKKTINTGVINSCDTNNTSYDSVWSVSAENLLCPAWRDFKLDTDKVFSAMFPGIAILTKTVATNVASNGSTG